MKRNSNFGDSPRIKRKENIPKDLDYISASDTRYYALGDPLIDYLKRYKNSGNNEFGEFTKFILQLGINFEQEIMDKLDKKFPKETVRIINGNGNLKHHDSRVKYYKETMESMTSGVPIIYQGYLCDDEKGVHGIPDFIIRDDFLTKIFDDIKFPPIFTNKSIFKHGRHYVIIDCKWTSISLCIDGNIKTTPVGTANKVQIYLYHHCLEKIQKSGNNISYILAKNIDYKGYTYGPFDFPVAINYEKRDNKYVNLFWDAIGWIKDLRENGMNWKLPDEDPNARWELYPNMKNEMDDPWHEYKRKLSDKIKEITSIWNCGLKHRSNCFAQGIKSWDDPRCNSKTLGIFGKKISPIVDNILEVNRGNTEIFPNKLERIPEWLRIDQMDVFIDFEYLNKFGEVFPFKSEGEILYMIGIYSKKYGYKNFTVKSLSGIEEKIMVNKFLDYLEEIKPSRVIFWSNAEENWIIKMLTKYDLHDRYGDLDINLFDLLKYIKQANITFKGVFKYGLKEVATGLYKSGKIKSKWEDLDSAMDVTTNILKISKEYPDSLDKNPMIERVIRYNETDCKVLYEILRYLCDYYSIEDILSVHSSENNSINSQPSLPPNDDLPPDEDDSSVDLNPREKDINEIKENSNRKLGDDLKRFFMNEIKSLDKLVEEGALDQLNEKIENINIGMGKHDVIKNKELVNGMRNKIITLEKVMNSKISDQFKIKAIEKTIALERLPMYSLEWISLRNKIEKYINGNAYEIKINESKFSDEDKKHLLDLLFDKKNKESMNIVESALKIPFNIETTDIDMRKHLLKIKRNLDDRIHGMDELKKSFLFYLFENMSLCKKPIVIGLHGKPGIGKSSFVDAISSSFDMPSFKINMGIIDSADALLGTDKVFTNSHMGLITEFMIKAKRQNFILVLEEMDKISNDESIYNSLNHLFDPEYNDKIRDNYLGVSYSLQHLIIVVTMNNISMLPPPLLSRIKIFSLPIPSNEDRIKTIEVKIIPKLLKEFNFAEDDIKFTYDAIDMIIRDIREEGLRKTINLTKEIIRKLCTYKYLGKEYSKQIFDIDIDIKFPLIVDIKLLRKIHKMTDKRETYLDMFI